MTRYFCGFLLLLFSLFLLAFALDDFFAATQKTLLAQAVPASRLGIKQLRQRLVRLGVLSVAPNPQANFLVTKAPPSSLANDLLPDKGGHGAHAYTLGNKPDPRLYPSSVIALDQNFSQIPTLSLAVDAYDLQGGRKSLFDNIDRRGRNWERGGFISYFAGGELRFAAPIGVKIHGGKSRHLKGAKSFRLIFRDLYGLDKMPTGTIFPIESGSHSEFIAHSDMRPVSSRALKTRLINPLAYDLVRHIGGYAPLTVPARFYLNGEYQGLYVLTERLDVEYFRKFFGHTDFTFFKERDESGDGGLRYGSKTSFQSLRNWAFAKDTSWEMEEVNKVIDLENFTRSMIALIYCGNTDPFQAVVAKDDRAANGRWLWFNWDMDHCFIDFYRSRKHAWEQPTLAFILGASKGARERVTFQIFSKLMRRPGREYPKYLFSLSQQILNEQLTPEYLQERATHYEKIAHQYAGLDEQRYQRMIRSFFENRHKVVFEQFARKANE